MKNKDKSKIAIWIFLLLNITLALLTSYCIDMILIVVIISKSIAEEFVFRKFFFNFILKFFPKEVSILLVAGIFSLLHFGLGNVIYIFCYSVMLSLIYLKMHSIWYSIFLHAFSNMVYYNSNQCSIVKNGDFGGSILGILIISEITMLLYLLITAITGNRNFH